MTGIRDKTAIDLAHQLAGALASGDHTEAVRLNREIERRLTGDVTDQPPDYIAPPAIVPVRKQPRSGRTGRQVVAGALAEIGVACRARIVADYTEARYGQHVELRALAALRRDERRAWARSSARPTYIVPALEGRFFQPVRGLLTLSDWPLERRILGPWSERADHLTATVQLARQLAWLGNRDPEVAERLAPVVAGLAMSIPGAVLGSDVDTARVESAARAELLPLAAKDEPWRREAATRARRQLAGEQQLWGANIGLVAKDGE